MIYLLLYLTLAVIMAGLMLRLPNVREDYEDAQEGDSLERAVFWVALLLIAFFWPVTVLVVAVIALAKMIGGVHDDDE